MQLTKAQLKLVEATLESLMEEGMDGCSVRRISERAGCSVGLINYHFSSVDNLVAAAYKHLAAVFLEDAIKQSSDSGGSSREQLSLFLEKIFSAEVMQRKVLKAWLVFWGLLDTSTAIQQAHESSNGEFQAYLQAQFTSIAEQERIDLSPRLAAIGLTAMIDGLWLEWCLQSKTFSPQECVAICERWVDAV